jgi:hypothetical protein
MFKRLAILLDVPGASNALQALADANAVVYMLYIAVVALSTTVVFIAKKYMAKLDRENEIKKQLDEHGQMLKDILKIIEKR